MAEYSRKVRSKKEKSGETIAYSEAAMRHNGAVLEYCRTSLAALSGCTAGILGLTGLWGFLFYFATALALWLMLVLRTMNTWNRFLRSRTTFLTTGLFGGLFTYVLFWTFFLRHRARLLSRWTHQEKVCWKVGAKKRSIKCFLFTGMW